jgi:cbb3-type cytochrome oxidase subunit 1
MDRYVKNFIIMSIVYLAAASVLGIGMMMEPEFLKYRFVHTHFMLIGWVSMMIYGVGYHILPRFAGRLLKNPLLAELQFWFANIGLIGMVVFYSLLTGEPDNIAYGLLAGISGAFEVFSSLLFFYNMYTVLFAKEEQQEA